jgi:hypothetical protein
MQTRVSSFLIAALLHKGVWCSRTQATELMVPTTIVETSRTRWQRF